MNTKKTELKNFCSKKNFTFSLSNNLSEVKTQKKVRL